MEEKVVDIDFIDGAFLVWSVEDVVFLRKQCRIIGEASGTLPTSTRQNQVLGVPVSLLTEQAFFLMDKGIARIHDGLQYKEHVHNGDEVVQFKTDRRNAFKAKSEEDVAQGKRTKSILSKYPIPLDEQLSLQGAVLIKTMVDKRPDENDSTESAEDRHTNVLAKAKPLLNLEKFAAFKDLWAKKYYITPGIKFGGDYLLYPGDPSEFHASHIALVRNFNTSMTGFEIVSLSRLATQVNKSIMVVSVGNDMDLKYLTIDRAFMDSAAPLREYFSKRSKASQPPKKKSKIENKVNDTLPNSSDTHSQDPMQVTSTYDNTASSDNRTEEAMANPNTDTAAALPSSFNTNTENNMQE